MNKDTLIKYAELKQEIKILEAKLEEIQPEVLEMLVESGNDEVELGGLGTFVLAKRRKYIYTPAVQSLEAELKDQKKLEEQTGDATYTENPYVLFKGIKE